MNFWDWCVAHGTGLIIAAVAVVVLIIVICIAVGVHKRKKRIAESATEKPSAIKKIYVTTDGYFSNRPDIKKSRLIAVLEQREDDGAIAIVKIFSKDGKEQKIGKTFIPGLILRPSEHPAISKESIVGRQVIIGVKRNNQTKPKSLYPNDFEDTGDKLTDIEYKKIKEEVHNDEPKFRNSFNKKLRKWFNHFKE